MNAKAWSTALAAYLAAKAAEDTYDRDHYMPAFRRWNAAANKYGLANVPADHLIPDEVDAAIDRLQNLRFNAEDALMGIPSPDAVAFAQKFLIAHGEGRDANGWDDMLEAEARRLIGEGAQ
jgi:hypothetical protein